MSLAELLLDLSPADGWKAEVARLEQLEGAEIFGGEVRWLASIDESADWIRPSMPLWLVPVAVTDLPDVISLDLRPSHVATGAMRFVDDVGGVLRVSALSLDEHLEATMLRSCQRFGRGLSLAGTQEDVRAAEGLVGRFLTRPLEPASALAKVPNPSEWRWDRGHRAPSIVASAAARREGDPTLEYAREALQHSPDNLLLRWTAATFLLNRGDVEGACREVARCAPCPTYTRGRVELRELPEFVEIMGGMCPDAFTPEVRAKLAAIDGPALRTLLDDAMARGDLEGAVRLAVDLGCETRTTYDLVAPVFEPLFEQLGWGWALRLCELRQIAWR